ncbi:hypothetical protein ABZP36_007100, partial [Zizania latifolia]
TKSPEYIQSASKWQAFEVATLSGFAEPLRVVVVAYLFPINLNPEVLEGLLSSVGRVMAFLTLHEMLPLPFDYAGQKQVVKAVFVGMAFMSARLCLIHTSQVLVTSNVSSQDIQFQNLSLNSRGRS